MCGALQIDASHIPEGPTPEADVDVSDKIQTVIMDSAGPLEEENIGATATGHADAQEHGNAGPWVLCLIKIDVGVLSPSLAR